MDSIGTFVFNDCPLRSLMASVLSTEDIKSLFDVREEASVPARYNVAIFPERCPRIFTANTGPNSDTGYYFSTYGHDDIAEFARRRPLNAFSTDNLAVCRRMIVFRPTRAEIGLVTANVQNRRGADYNEQMNRRQAFLTGLDTA